jgi:hypothetical protein
VTDHQDSSRNDRSVSVAKFTLAQLGHQVPTEAILAALRAIAADAIASTAPVGSGWMSFPGPGMIRCPGAYRSKAQGGAMRPCAGFHGRVPAGSVAFIRVAGTSWRPGAVTDKCDRCGCSYELLCLGAGEAA